MYPRQTPWGKNEALLVEDDDDVVDLLTLPEVRSYGLHEGPEGELGLYRLLERPESLFHSLLGVQGRTKRSRAHGSSRGHRAPRASKRGSHLSKAA